MCYASPGPRCAKVASERMKKAKLSGDPQRIRETTEQYLLTIPGINTLKKRGYTEEAAKYQAKRDELIAASKSGAQEDTSEHPNVSKTGKYLIPKEKYTDEEITDMIRARFRRGGWSPNEIKKMNITPDTPFIGVFGSSSNDLSFNSDSKEAYRWFNRGQCARLAYEIAKHTKKPLIVWTDPSFSSWSGHVAVKVEDGTVLDINGLSSYDATLNRFHGYGNKVSEWTMREMKADDEFLNLMGLTGEDELYGEIDDTERAVVSHISHTLIDDFQIPKV